MPKPKPKSPAFDVLRPASCPRAHPVQKDSNFRRATLAGIRAAKLCLFALIMFDGGRRGIPWLNAILICATLIAFVFAHEGWGPPSWR